MQLRLNSSAQQKQRELLEAQQKNSLLKNQLQYSKKLLAQLSTKISAQQNSLKITTQTHNSSVFMNKNLINQSQQLTSKSIILTNEIQQMKRNVVELRKSYQQLQRENVKTLQQIKSIQQLIQKGDHIMDANSCKYQTFQNRKIQLQVKIKSQKAKLQELNRLIRDKQNKIQQKANFK